MSVAQRFKSPAFLSTLFLIGFGLLMFRVVWPADQVIQSNDYNYGLMGMYKAEMPASFFEGFWRGFPLLGRAGHSAPTWTNLSLAILPLDVYMDWIYALNLLLASGFMMAFLRLRGCSWIPAMGGALTAYWLGSNLTLIYPGHLEKYGVLLFASATLYCLEQTLQKKSWRWSMLAGGSLGWMFMHQADLALFFGFVLGAWFLFGLLTRFPTTLPKRVFISVPLLGMALLFGYESYRFSMANHVNNVEVLQEGSAEDKWNFATQWSWPPQESLDLIAPGYWGWMSQHPEAPYYGEMGQSPEWAESQQGFPNFKLESQYLGLLPFALCILAFFSRKTRRPEVLFWSIALAVTFLLACGKYTPLYELFFKLPLVNSIRNPNKFLQVFQWILGILCALGLQPLWETTLSDSKRKKAGFILIFISLLAGAASLSINPTSAEQLQGLAQGPWEGQAAGILRNRQVAWLHLSLFAATAGGLIWGSASLRFRKLCLGGLVLLIAVDGLLLSREYLKPANTRFLKENALADFLKEHLGEQRVSVVDTRGLYNFYLTHLFPYQHIPFSDIAVAPRLQTDYQRYFEEVGEDRVRIWQEFGVKYILASRQVFQMILQNPGMDQVFEEVFSYDIVEYPRGGLRVAPGKVGVSGQHVVLEVNLPSERFALLPPNEDEAFLFGKRSGEITGVLQSSSGFMLQVKVPESGAFLRLADHYDPKLRARVNRDEPQPLVQSDDLFMGLELPEGIHTVELFLPPPDAGTLAQWMGLLISLIVGLSLIVKRSPRTPCVDI